MSHHEPSPAEQARLIEALKKEVAPIVENNAPLRAFCNEHTYVRYLRARQWNLQKASKMLHATLEWRLEYKPHLIKFKDIKFEISTGKEYVMPQTDKAGRPIVLMRPRFENSKNQEDQLKLLVYVLESASRKADKAGCGKMAWLLDFEGYSISNAPPMSMTLKCNNVLMHHYPERLGCAVCYHAPYFFSLTWKAVRPFVDPVTQQKIVFIEKGPKEKEEMESRFHMEGIEKCMGGAVPDYVFDLDKVEQEMQQYDAEVAAEIAEIEAQIKASSVAAATQSTSDLSVAVQPTTIKA